MNTEILRRHNLLLPRTPFQKRSLFIARPGPVPRPLTVKDRERLRAVRQAEMKAWVAADKPALGSRQMRTKPSIMNPFTSAAAQEQKWELGIFILVALIALVAIFSGLFESGSLTERWFELVRALGG